MSATAAAALLAIDQALKALALTVQYEYRCVADTVMCFGLAANARSGFGLIAADSVWFVFLIPPVLVGVCVLVLRTSDPPWSYYAVTLLATGTSSNWLDRLRLGFVVDYVGPRLPTTNLADWCVAAGIALLVYARLRHPRAPRA